MLKLSAITRQIKFLKRVPQQYATVRLYNGGVPRVLITGLFIREICTGELLICYHKLCLY